MTDGKHRIETHGYYKVLEKDSAISIAFNWDGKRIAFPHWDFKWIKYSVPTVQILFSTGVVSFEPPEDFNLEYFLDSFQVLKVTNIYQKGSMILKVSNLEVEEAEDSKMKA